MTKTFLIASVAGLALVAPQGIAAKTADTIEVQKPEKERQPKGKERRAERDDRRAERPDRREARQERGDRGAERRQEQRAERRQEQRAERRQEQRAERRQEQRAERRAERREQQRAERRAVERADRDRQQRAERRNEMRERERQDAERQAERREDYREQQRRVERVQDRREQLRRAERRAEAIRDRREDYREEYRENRGDARRAAIALDRNKGQRGAEKRYEKELRKAAKEYERRAERREAYRDWVRRDQRRDNYYNDDGYRYVTTGARFNRDWYEPVPTRYRSRYDDDRRYYYRYDDDLSQMYRVNRSDDLVSAVIPIGLALGLIDQRVPNFYQTSAVPYGYSGAYYDTPDYNYRAIGPGVYRVDAKTQLVTVLVSLLTGQDFSVGQAMPAGYDVYNVPYDYRSRYRDSDDAWYRYDDGTIYQVDPRTRYVQNAYPLYEADYAMGGAWPTDYPDYNVPYGYQGLYYDTPDYQYRSAGNTVYRVDPKDQLIRAAVALVTGQDFVVGQPMPTGYDAYNVPYDYRERFVDDDDRYYRYADGYVYGVDADSGLIADSWDIYS